MELSKIASAIYNDVVAGLSGMNANPTISLEQLEDEVVEERNTVIKEWYEKNLLKKHDLMMAINCVPVNCDDQNKCCSGGLPKKNALHFEMPQLMDGLGRDSIEFIGSTDRHVSYDIYYSLDALDYRKYKKRSSNKPYVYVERTPNKNNMYDCWIFGAPFVQNVAVIGIFRDLRQLAQFNCCNTPEFLDFGSISNEVKRRLTAKKLQYYRQNLVPPHPTDLIPR